MSKYTEYTTRISNDPSYYGSICTQDDADRITKSLADMIQNKFPGISVEIQREARGGSSSTTGPDHDVEDQINDWISNNWTAAL